jgi:hypothetical protein
MEGVVALPDVMAPGCQSRASLPLDLGDFHPSAARLYLDYSRDAVPDGTLNTLQALRALVADMGANGLDDVVTCRDGRWDVDLDLPGAPDTS